MAKSGVLIAPLNEWRHAVVLVDRLTLCVSDAHLVEHDERGKHRSGA